MPTFRTRISTIIQTVQQIRLAKMFFKAGADVILGTHPHVLQPSEIYYERADKAQFVIYSLGNFISDQNGLPRKSSMILNLHFGIDPVTGDPYFKEATSGANLDMEIPSK